MDDTFALFEEESYCDQFFTKLNSLHRSLTFAYVKETNGKLPYLDVKVKKSDSQFLASVYRKLTFTGQYMRWDSFGLKNRKTNLIAILFHRALIIAHSRN